MMASPFNGSLDKYKNKPTVLFPKESSDFYTIRSVGNGNNCMLIIIVQFNLLSKKLCRLPETHNTGYSRHYCVKSCRREFM